MTPEYQEIFDWIIGKQGKTMRFGFDRMRDLLEYFDHPEEKLRFVHIAGTNGKGSTAALTASILAASGQKVGMFISPYLERYNERVRIIDGAEGLRTLETVPSHGEIPTEKIVELVDRMKRAIEDLGLDPETRPTHFEIWLLMAFIYFYDEACDIVVLETGLGGTLDATNIIPQAEINIITSISYDHMNILGSTIESIADNKAGIIKTASPVILADPRDSALSAADAATVRRVIETQCQHTKAPLTIASWNDCEILERSIHGQRFLHRPTGLEFQTRLAGEQQLLNASVAILGCAKLLPPETFRQVAQEGVRRCVWPGRLDVILEDPIVLIDGAHNPEACHLLIQNLQELLPGRTVETVLGFLEDKDYRTMLDDYFCHSGLEHGGVHCLTPASERAHSAEALSEEVRARRPDLTIDMGTIEDDLLGWIRTAKVANRVVVAWGSFYVIGPLRTQVLQWKAEGKLPFDA